MSRPVALYRPVWLQAAFSRGAKHPGWAICLGVDRSGPRWTGSLMKKPAFTRASLSDVRVIILIIRVLVEELLCQSVIGWILVLECLFVRCAWAPAVTSCLA
jgi:hypothetical protein